MYPSDPSGPRIASLYAEAELKEMTEQLTEADELYDEEKYILAFKIYEKLGRIGHLEALNRLMRAYLLGQGCNRDLTKANESYNKIHNIEQRKREDSIYKNVSVYEDIMILALRYYHGADIPKNLERSKILYEKAEKLKSSC